VDASKQAANRCKAYALDTPDLIGLGYLDARMYKTQAYAGFPFRAASCRFRYELAMESLSSSHPTPPAHSKYKTPT